MNRLQELLENVRTLRASELLIVPGTEPRYKEGFQWKSLPTDVISSHETRNLCTSILNESQRHEFIELQQICASQTINEEMQVRFHLSQHRLGVTGHFRLIAQTTSTPQDLGLPQIVTDFIHRESGVVLVTSPQGHGKWTTVCALLQELAKYRSVAIATVEKAVKVLLPSDAGLFSFFERGLTTSSKWFDAWSDDPFKVLALDLADDPDGLARAVRLSEKGKLVFVTLSGPSIAATLNHALMREPSFGPRLAEQLLGGLGQRLIWSSPLAVLAFEVLVGTPQVKKALSEVNFSEIEEIMRTTGEKTSMRTMNQSLLQNLIRRKIDVKTAFQFSPEPDELDQLLSKVGI